ncbi:MAG: metallophosphoesterase [Bacteroidota bacterium]
MKKFIFASDLHGDVQDWDTVQALYEFVETYKPDIKVFGGDLFDFRNIRRGAGAAERQDSMAADVEAGMEFLEKFHPQVLLLGNHDKRLWDTAQHHKDGIVQDAAKAGVKSIVNLCRKLKCKLIPYDASKGYYDLGKIRFIHGFHAGVFASKRHAEIYSPPSGIVLHGHTHAIQYHSVARLKGGAGMGVGCLANTDMDYNKHQTGRMLHQNGFAYGYSDGSDWQAFQAKKGTNGKWRVATKIETIG